MKPFRYAGMACLAAVALALPICGGEQLGQDAIRAAIAKSLPLLEAGSKVSMEKRKQCFTCHNQGLPVLALTAARRKGFQIDEENLKRQVEFTAGFLEKNRTNYLAGKGQGGAALTAGYALWTLEKGEWKPDLTTAAVTEYLLTWQNDLPHWKPQTIRPPTEESPFTVTFVALNGLAHFGLEEQKDRISRRREAVRQWMAQAPVHHTEDRVFRLRALRMLGAASEEIKQSARQLWDTQQEDGGWAQLTGMKSDAYATGAALAALNEAADVSCDDPRYQRGLAWLLANQKPDGSWHVRTRSEPIQVYYESGYPHGDDQFISITAAGWVTIALLAALP